MAQFSASPFCRTFTDGGAVANKSRYGFGVAVSSAEPPEPAPKPPEDDEPESHPFGIFPLIVLLVLIAGGLFLMFEMRDSARMQDCVQSGRKNCAPIDTTDLK